LVLQIHTPTHQKALSHATTPCRYHAKNDAQFKPNYGPNLYHRTDAHPSQSQALNCIHRYLSVEAIPPMHNGASRKPLPAKPQIQQDEKSIQVRRDAENFERASWAS